MEGQALGRTYRCPVCDAEVTLVSPTCGTLCLRCCNVDMEPQPELKALFRCPVCDAEACIVLDGGGKRRLRCCNEDMERIAA